MELLEWSGIFRLTMGQRAQCECPSLVVGEPLMTWSLLCSGLAEASEKPVWTFCLVLGRNKELIWGFPTHLDWNLTNSEEVPEFTGYNDTLFQELIWLKFNKWWLLALLFLQRWLLKWSVVLRVRYTYSAHLAKYLEILFDYAIWKRKNPSATSLHIPCGQWVLSVLCSLQLRASF